MSPSPPASEVGADTGFPNNPPHPQAKRVPSSVSPDDQPKPRKRRQPAKSEVHNTSNATFLGSSDYYENEDDFEPKNKVDGNVTRRDKALNQLFRGKKNIKDVTKADFNAACREFPMHSVRAESAEEGDFRWGLKELDFGLYNHQLLGAAKMRRLEKRGERLFGGIQVDAIGLENMSLLACSFSSC